VHAPAGAEAPLWASASPDVFKLFVERAQTGILVLQDRQILFANPQAAQLTGYTVEELTAGPMSLGLLVAPEYLPLVREELRQRMQGVPGHPHDLQCIRKDGSRFDATVWGARIEIDGRPANLVSVHDVSHDKQTLRDLEALTRLLADAEQLCGMGSVSVDLITGQVLLSEGMWTLLGGLAPPPAISLTWLLDKVPEADHDTLRSLYAAYGAGKPREATHRIERADGSMRIVLHRGVIERNAQGKPVRVRGVVHDITEQRRAEQHAYRLARFDPVTDLPNRQSLHQRLTEAVRLANSEAGHTVALLILEIEQLAIVSETLGYAESDMLMKAVADRLSEAEAYIAMLAHLGGGEYAAMLTSARDETEPAALSAAHALLRALADPFTLDHHEIFVSCQIGITLFPKDGQDPDQLLRQAQAAIRQGREAGVHQIAFFTPQVDERIAQRLANEAGLRRALERNELFLHYQPQLSLLTGKIIGVEALVRWADPKRGELLPGDFIELAEETGLIVPINEWILRTACSQAKAWQQAGLPMPRISVNMPSKHLQRRDVVKHIEAVLLETGLDPRRLSLEVTEAMVMDNVEHVVTALRELKAIGIEIALDDFGTGYSSLSHLSTLPIDVIKIDRSFVNDVTASPQSVSMTRAIINMAHSLQMKVLAEGVENEGQLALLIAHRCDLFQGFYFSRPVAPTVIEAMLIEGRQLPANLLNRQPSRRTLLLVDDEKSIVSALKRLLRLDGYHIVSANDGPEGLQRLAEHHVDVIVSDQRMPGMTGVEFLRRAKELYPDTIRIVLSGYTELQSITDAINEGAIYKFLTKPWDDDHLRSHIADAFRQKEMADENRRLGGELSHANQELDHLNKRLTHLLEIQQLQIGQDEARLAVGRHVLESIPAAVIGLDNEGTIVFVNTDAENLIQSGAMLIDQHIEQVLDPILVKAWQSSVSEPHAIHINHVTYQAVCRTIMGNEGPRGKVMVLLPQTAAAPHA
jgi:diguanylate cyclase (GGDEF)-like protein/PAS domain S-box-containing protein